MTPESRQKVSPAFSRTLITMSLATRSFSNSFLNSGSQY